MTLLFVMLSIFPIVEEQNPGLFTIRMLAVLVGLQLAGAAFYVRAARPRHRSMARAAGS